MNNDSYSLSRELADAIDSGADRKVIEELDRKVKREKNWGGLEYNPDVSPIEDDLSTLDNSEKLDSTEDVVINGSLSDELPNVALYPHEAINSIGKALITLEELYNEIKENIKNFKVDIDFELTDMEQKILQDTFGGNKVFDEGIITSEVYEEILKDSNKTKSLYRIKNIWDEKASSIEGNVYAELIEIIYFIKRDLVNCYKLLDDVQIKKYDSSLSIRENDLSLIKEIKQIVTDIEKGSSDSADIKNYYSNINRMQCISNICVTQKYFADGIDDVMHICLNTLRDSDETTPILNIDKDLSSVLLTKGYEGRKDAISKLRDKTSMFFDKELRENSNARIFNSIVLYTDVLSDLIESLRINNEYGEEDVALLIGIESAIKEKDEAMFELIGNTRMTNVVLDELISMIISKDKIRRQFV